MSVNSNLCEGVGVWNTWSYALRKTSRASTLLLSYNGGGYIFERAFPFLVVVLILEKDVFASTHAQNVGLRYLVDLFGLRYLGRIPMLQLFLFKMSSTCVRSIKPFDVYPQNSIKLLAYRKFCGYSSLCLV